MLSLAFSWERVRRGEGSPAVICSKNKCNNHPSHPFSQNHPFSQSHPFSRPHPCLPAPTCPNFSVFFRTKTVILEQEHN